MSNHSRFMTNYNKLMVPSYEKLYRHSWAWTTKFNNNNSKVKILYNFQSFNVLDIILKV